MKILFGILLFFSLFVSLYAHGSHEANKEQRTCGTKSPSQEEIVALEEKRRAFVEKECSHENKKRNPNWRICDSPEERAKRDPYQIHLAVHVIYDPSNNNTGNLTDSEIQGQVDQLNLDYAPTDFQFVLYSVDRTGNSEWFNGMGNFDATHYQIEYEMTQALAVGLPFVFQIYFVNFDSGLLGYCYFPWDFPQDDPSSGCFALYSTIPGGEKYPFDEGKTLTHEIGHGLGLLHTFQGGCTMPNDYVDDTNMEDAPHWGCPEPLDTCGEGVFPITNYMSYVDDRCMIEFTPGQNTRMVQMTTQYRPALLLGPDQGYSDTCGSFVDSGGLEMTYSNNQDLEYTFCSPTGAIQVLFNSFEVEAHPDCEYDYMMVYDGDSSSAPLMIGGFGVDGKFCAASSPQLFASTNQEGCLTFTFHSDADVMKAGWDAVLLCLGGEGSVTLPPPVTPNYSVAPTDQPTMGPNVRCGSFVDVGGVSGDYPSYVDDVQTFCAFDGDMHAVFNYFDVEYDSTCTWDWLEVYDGPTTDSPIIYKRTFFEGKNCGWENPGPFTSTNPEGCLTFVFHSDSYMNGGGWEADLFCLTESRFFPLYGMNLYGSGPIRVTPHGIPTIYGEYQLYVVENPGYCILQAEVIKDPFMKCDHVFCRTVAEENEATHFIRVDLGEDVFGLKKADGNGYVCHLHDKLRLCSRKNKMLLFSSTPSYEPEMPY